MVEKLHLFSRKKYLVRKSNLAFIFRRRGTTILPLQQTFNQSEFCDYVAKSVEKRKPKNHRRVLQKDAPLLFLPKIRDYPQDVMIQQNGTPRNFAIFVRQYLDQKLESCWNCRGGLVS